MDLDLVYRLLLAWCFRCADLIPRRVAPVYEGY